jgi:hypothetical protein
VFRGTAPRAALLITSGVALLAAGCGSGGSSTPTGLRLQREDLVATARTLAAAEPAVDGETQATKLAWPFVVDGLSSRPGPTARVRIHEAAARASALRLPAPFEEERARALTGVAAGLAGTYRRFSGLSTRGWQLIDYDLAQLATGSPASASFARKSVALYIESVYDAHFGLAQIGKQLLAGYHKLGGPAAFGSSLTQAEAEQLAGAYSEAHFRLHPHEGVRLGS